MALNFTKILTISNIFFLLKRYKRLKISIFKLTTLTYHSVDIYIVVVNLKPNN